MNDRPDGNDDHENMCDDRQLTDLPAIHVHAKAKKKKKNSDNGAEK